MARLYPEIDVINRLRVKPTEGELHILRILASELDDAYKIYFNPYLDGDRPDVVIVKENVGIFLIEVKDWELKHYSLSIKNEWTVQGKQDRSTIKSPQKQVFYYKKNLFEMHIRELGILEAINKRYYGTVKCFVYLHKTTKSQLNSFYGHPLSSIKETISTLNSDRKSQLIDHKKYEKRSEYLKRSKSNLERDLRMSFSQDDIKNLINKIEKEIDNSLFSDTLFDEVCRRISPPEHVIDQGKPLNLTKQQLKLAVSLEGKAKIKGVAGCGKTEIIANRATNSHIRHDSDVLILTFNITLKPLIKDRISRIQNTSKPDGIEVNNYHQFFLSMCNEHNILIHNKVDSLVENGIPKEDAIGIVFSDINTFSDIKTKKYNTILIDEIQDYKTEWINIIESHFLSGNGEMVLFGDQSQNIYHRKEDKGEFSIFKGYGRWVKMTKSLRSKLDTPLVYLFKKFQEKYVSPLHTDAESFESTFTQGLLSYDLLQYKRATLPLKPTETCEFIRKINRKHNLIPNDVAILCSDRNILKQINDEFIKIEKTIAMVETTEELNSLKKFSGPETVHEDIEKLKRRKKTFFMQNSGLTKFSTVHSFKGMDSSTVFYILTEADSPELIYTGITRAKTNLIIIDLSNSTYSDYLEKEIGNL